MSASKPLCEGAPLSPLQDTETLKVAYEIAKREKDDVANKGRRADSFKTIVKALRSVLPEKFAAEKIDKVKQEVGRPDFCAGALGKC